MLLEANFRASRSKQRPADCSAICVFTSFGQFEFEWFYPFVPLRDLFVTRGHLLQLTYLLQSCKYFFLVIISLSTFSMVSLTIQILFLCSQSANLFRGFWVLRHMKEELTHCQVSEKVLSCIFFHYINFFFFFWPQHGMWDPGTEPAFPTSEAWDPNHGTTKVPIFTF